MQVLVGPTYDMEAEASASSSPACVRDCSSGVPASAAEAQDDNNKAVSSASTSSCLFLNGDEDENDDVVVGDQNTFGSDNSSESSSIGAPGDSEEEEEEDDDVLSSKKDVGLPRNKFSMDSLEDTLPNSKRGLSNHYSGKSKSFANLTEVTSMKTCTAIKDLEKEENPFNKRRRLLIANKWSRKFFYSRHNPKSMPLFPVLPDHDEDEQERSTSIDDEEHQREVTTSKQAEDRQPHLNKLKVNMGFKSQSCFCLADLAEEEEEEEEEVK